MKAPAILTAVVFTLSLTTSVALADDPDGSGWTFNTGTGEIGLRVSNNASGGRTLMSVDFDLGSGTVDSASTSGGSCTTAAHTGSCTFGSALGQGQHANVFIETPGPKPASVGVTLHKSDASTQGITAGECTETQFPAQVSLPDATAEQPYSQQLADQGGPSPHYYFYGSGVLPPVGLSLSGLLSGTPPANTARTDPYVFFVNVYDGNGCSSFPKYSLKVNDAPTGGGGGGEGGCVPQIAASKYVTNLPGLDPNEAFNVVDLTSDVVEMRNHEYAAPAGESIVYAISLGNSADCPGRVTVTDLLPAGFEVEGTESSTLSADTPVTLADQVPESRTDDGGRTSLTFTVNVPAAGFVRGHPESTIPGFLTIYIEGFGVVGDEINQAQVGSATTNSVAVHVTPEPEVSHLEFDAEEADGDAEDGSSKVPVLRAGAAAVPRSPLWKLRRVQVAIQVLKPKHKTAGCVWIRDRRGHTKQTPKFLGSCGPTVWLTAKGTRHWRLKLRKRLPRGRYLLFARALNRAGVSDNHFSRSRHNERRLTVR
jgi:hypothetical protein